ncbi:MAG TPA: ABC transporter substrate-binding protein [Thermomicrobiales bacterium]|nr:ABC transporter substrate-binding protein [Thermomicrobiales bacterium]
MSTRRTFIQASGGVVAAGLLARNASAQDASPASGTPEVAIGDISVLPLKESGKLIIHADQPLYPPWFIDNDPSNGQGFEGALAYAIAERLGFTADQVEWGYTSFNASYAPGPKPFDFYLTEVSITEARAEAVGFSDSYYDDPLVTIAPADSPVLEATSIAELRPFTWSTQVGTTFHTYLTDVIQPEQDILVFDTNADSVTALTNGTVDGNIQNLQNAIFITTIQFEGLAIGGLLPGAVGDGMGLVTELGSPLIPYLNAAIASLKADGTHQALVDEWLPVPADLQTYTE